MGNLVTGKEIADIPLNGRNWVSLNLLTPGAARFYGISMSFSNITQSVAPGNFVVNGLRGSNNAYLLDGINQQDVEAFILSDVFRLSTRWLNSGQSQEMPAPNSRVGQGALVTAVTKSGTKRVPRLGVGIHQETALSMRETILPRRSRN